MNASKLARENDVLRELIHVNQVLIDLELQRKQEKNQNVNNEFFDVNWYNKNKDVYESLEEKKETTERTAQIYIITV